MEDETRKDIKLLKILFQWNQNIEIFPGFTRIAPPLVLRSSSLLCLVTAPLIEHAPLSTLEGVG